MIQKARTARRALADAPERKLHEARGPRELGHLARKRVQQADSLGLLAMQDEETVGGGAEHAVVAELRDVHLDALAGAGVEEPAAAASVRGGGGRELLVVVAEHDPLPRVEARVLQHAARARVRAASPPREARGSEADVVRHVVGEDALGDQTGRTLIETRPVPPPGADGGAGPNGARPLGAPGYGEGTTKTSLRGGGGGGGSAGAKKPPRSVWLLPLPRPSLGLGCGTAAAAGAKP